MTVRSELWSLVQLEAPDVARFLVDLRKAFGKVELKQLTIRGVRYR